MYPFALANGTHWPYLTRPAPPGPPQKTTCWNCSASVDSASRNRLEYSCPCGVTAAQRDGQMLANQQSVLLASLVRQFSLQQDGFVDHGIPGGLSSPA